MAAKTTTGRSAIAPTYTHLCGVIAVMLVLRQALATGLDDKDEQKDELGSHADLLEDVSE